MRILIPRIVRDVPLGDYAPELAGQALQVWVNPPASLLDDYQAQRTRLSEALEQLQQATGDAGRQAAGAEITAALSGIQAWYAQIWSSGPDTARHWTVDDVAALDRSETDPALGNWLRGRTWDAIREHRRREKKA